MAKKTAASARRTGAGRGAAAARRNARSRVAAATGSIDVGSDLSTGRNRRSDGGKAKIKGRG